MAAISLRPKGERNDYSEWDTVFITDNPTDIVTYMWGRQTGHYHLFINGREYDWSGVMDLLEIASYIQYCIELDKAFYE